MPSRTKTKLFANNFPGGIESDRRRHLRINRRKRTEIVHVEEMPKDVALCQVAAEGMSERFCFGCM